MSHDVDIVLPDTTFEDDSVEAWDDGALSVMLARLRTSRRDRKTSSSYYFSSESPSSDIPSSTNDIANLLRLVLLPGVALPLTSLYTSLKAESFTEFLDSARIYAPFHPMKRAAVAAQKWASDHPDERVDLAKVAADTDFVREHGVFAQINKNLTSLKASSVQPNIPLAPNVKSDRRLVPPYPSSDRMDVIHDLANGGHLPPGPCEEILPPPSPRPPRSIDEEKAIERLIASDHRGDKPSSLNLTLFSTAILMPVCLCVSLLTTLLGKLTVKRVASLLILLDQVSTLVHTNLL